MPKPFISYCLGCGRLTELEPETQTCMTCFDKRLDRMEHDAADRRIPATEYWAELRRR